MEILNELLANQIEFQKSLEAVNRKLDAQAQKEVTVKLDHHAMANQIKTGLPSADQFEKVNEQLKRTISSIPDKIPVQVSDEILGFTNFKALLIHYGIFLSIMALIATGITYAKNQEIEVLKEYRQNAGEFVGWIQEKYPQVWKVWEKK